MLTAPDHPVGLHPEYVSSSNTIIHITRHNAPFVPCNYTVCETPADGSVETNPTKPIFWVEAKQTSDEVCREFRTTSGTETPSLFSLRRGADTAEWTIEEGGKLVAKFAPRRSISKDRTDIFILNVANGGREEVKLEVRGLEVSRVHHCVYLGDAMVAQIRLRTPLAAQFVPFVSLQWGLNIARGFDVSLASAILVYLFATLETGMRESRAQSLHDPDTVLETNGEAYRAARERGHARGKAFDKKVGHALKGGWIRSRSKAQSGESESEARI